MTSFHLTWHHLRFTQYCNFVLKQRHAGAVSSKSGYTLIGWQWLVQCSCIGIYIIQCV